MGKIAEKFVLGTDPEYRTALAAVFSIVTQGALRDDTKNGCEGDQEGDYALYQMSKQVIILSNNLLAICLICSPEYP